MIPWLCNSLETGFYSSPTFINLDFSQNFVIALPFPPLDILPNCLNIRVKSSSSSPFSRNNLPHTLDITFPSLLSPTDLINACCYNNAKTVCWIFKFLTFPKYEFSVLKILVRFRLEEYRFRPILTLIMGKKHVCYFLYTIHVWLWLDKWI